jgi:hypothetical protein
MTDIYKKIDELQDWVRENQARGNDEIFMAKVKEMHALMNEAFTFKGIK